MPGSADRRRIKFWRPDSPSIAGMVRLENEDRVKTTYSEYFSVVVIYAGAFDGWYRGGVRTHTAGAVKLKEPGEVHRGLRVHEPFTIQGAGFALEAVTEAAATLELRGTIRFKAPGFDAGHRATSLAFALHAALLRPDASELERSTLIAETLTELLAPDAAPGFKGGGRRAPRAVRLARELLQSAPADKVTLAGLARYAGLDKFRLVRAFRAEVGLPPYSYLTQVRVARARALLERGEQVADVAQAVGFYDQSQLHRHFRRIVGVTPGHYASSFNARTAQPRSPNRARDGGAIVVA